MTCSHLRQRLVDLKVDFPLDCAVHGCSEGHLGVYEVRWVQWPEMPSLPFSAPTTPTQSRVESKRAWLESVSGLWVDRLGTAILVEDHSRLLAAAQRELAETRAVLQDVLEAKGESWLAQLAERREELFRRIARETGPDGDCLNCRECGLVLPNHARRCRLAELMRILGPEETQRQVDAAHAEAVAEQQRFFVRYGGARLDFGPRDSRNHATINELIQSGRINLDEARRAIEGTTRALASQKAPPIAFTHIQGDAGITCARCGVYVTDTHTCEAP